MIPSAKVLWGEGLFLRPQHFQQQDAYHEWRLAQSTKLLHPYAWGVRHLKVDAQELNGEADNLSRSGILFFTEGDLHVELEVEADGEVMKRTGRLVRCERIHDSRRGWAVEFDG